MNEPPCTVTSESRTTRAPPRFLDEFPSHRHPMNVAVEPENTLVPPPPVDGALAVFPSNAQLRKTPSAFSRVTPPETLGATEAPFRKVIPSKVTSRPRLRLWLMNRRTGRVPPPSSTTAPPVARIVNPFLRLPIRNPLGGEGYVPAAISITPPSATREIAASSVRASWGTRIVRPCAEAVA